MSSFQLIAANRARSVVVLCSNSCIRPNTPIHTSHRRFLLHGIRVSLRGKMLFRALLGERRLRIERGTERRHVSFRLSLLRLFDNLRSVQGKSRDSEELATREELKGLRTWLGLIPEDGGELGFQARGRKLRV